jgi:bleomycin hydrolase
MKKIFISFIFSVLALSFVQAQAGYVFKDQTRLPTTSVKNQYKSGTCWSWSATSFFESEAMRLGVKNVPDISPMYAVRNMYKEKAIKYVRMQGKTNLGSGGELHDVLYTIKKYGMVPTEVYPGLNYGEENHVHAEIDEVIKDYCDGVLKAYTEGNSNGTAGLSTAWINGLDGILDAYFGKNPEKFTYQGKEYTPKTFASDYMKINPDNYMSLTSFTHHPFYENFILEIPDNWLWASLENVPLNELESTIDNALKNGYTVAWAADVSEKGFAARQGIAVIPAETKADISGTERAKWENISEEELNQQKYQFNQPLPEKEITQENRQIAFDRQYTTDDHGMHIVGWATDQNGAKYYIVKNSWGEYNKYNGYFYASRAFVLYKTTAIMVNKESVPKDIAKKFIK